MAAWVAGATRVKHAMVLFSLSGIVVGVVGAVLIV